MRNALLPVLPHVRAALTAKGTEAFFVNDVVDEVVTGLGVTPDQDLYDIIREVAVTPVLRSTMNARNPTTQLPQYGATHRRGRRGERRLIEAMPADELYANFAFRMKMAHAFEARAMLFPPLYAAQEGIAAVDEATAAMRRMM